MLIARCSWVVARMTHVSIAWVSSLSTNIWIASVIPCSPKSCSSWAERYSLTRVPTLTFASFSDTVNSGSSMLSSGWSMTTLADLPAVFLERWKIRTSRGLAICPWKSWPNRTGLDVWLTPVVSTYRRISICRTIAGWTVLQPLAWRAATFAEAFLPPVQLLFHSVHPIVRSLVQLTHWPTRYEYVWRGMYGSGHLGFKELCDLHGIWYIKTIGLGGLAEHGLANDKWSCSSERDRCQLKFFPLYFEKSNMSTAVLACNILIGSDVLLQSFSFRQGRCHWRTWLCNEVRFSSNGFRYDSTIMLMAPDNKIDTIIKHAFRHWILRAMANSEISCK